MFGRVWRAFCNMDGNDIKTSYKYPFASGISDSMKEWDKLSCKDRLDQIRDNFSQEEIGMLEAVLLQMGGGPLERMGLLDGLRWWVLGAHQPTGLNDIALHTRLRSGQSTLHRRMFDHAKSTGRLSYSFSTPVAKIRDLGSKTIVTSQEGQAWSANHVICTVPLNVLNDVEFDPPLHPAKRAASVEGSVNKCNKVHYLVSGRDLLSWSSWASPGKGLVAAFGDCNTEENKSHVVAFGPDAALDVGMQLSDVQAVQDSLRHLLPFKDGKIERIVSLPPQCMCSATHTLTGVP